MTKHLEERAMSARRAVEDSTAAVDPGTFSPTRSRAAGAVLVAVMLGAIGLSGWWLAASGTDGVETVNVADDEQSSPDAGEADQTESPTTTAPATTAPEATGPETTADGAVEYLVFDPAPSDDAIILTDAFIDEVPNALYDIYGHADADNPFTDGDLVVAMIEAEAAEQMPDSERSGEEVTIGNTTAYFESESPLVLSWESDDGAFVGMLSSSLTREEMLGVATSIVVDDEIDPAGLDLLAGDVRRGIGGASVTGIGQAVLYGEDDDTVIIDDAYLVAVELAAAPTDDDTLLTAVLYGLTGETNPATAWAASNRRTIEFEGRQVLVLNSAPGVIMLAFDTEWGPARITTISDNESAGFDDVLSLIPNLRPATEAEVEALIDASPSSAQDSDGEQDSASGPDLVTDGVALANGTSPDGSRWAVSLVDPGGERRLCRYDTAAASSEICSATASEALADGTRWIIAVAPEVAVTLLQTDVFDVERIELVDGDTVRDLDFVDGPAGPVWYIRPSNPISGPASGPILLRMQGSDGASRDLVLPDALHERAATSPGGSAQPTIVVMSKN